MLRDAGVYTIWRPTTITTLKTAVRRITQRYNTVGIHALARKAIRGLGQ
jgi:hypothetical protein